MTHRHIVRDGECIVSIAADYGVTPASLWNHADNRALRERREDPGVLQRGDVVAVPEPVPGPEVTPGRSHRFTATIARAEVDVILEDDDGQPLSGVAFCLRVGGRPITGTTDGEGRVLASVPAGARAAELILEPDTERARRVSLQLGALDPVASTTGVKQRLTHLGYALDELGHAVTAQLSRALTSFQHDEGLSETGEADDATRARLRERHGS